MHEKVKEYLERKRQEREEEKEQNRRLCLLKLGLYEREFSEDGVSSRYPDWDHETGKAFKKVPVDVTDDEYEAICSFEKEGLENQRSENPIAKVLVVIAWITFIGGFLAGIVLANQEVLTGYYSTDNVFVWSVAITYWAASFVSGVVFLGFAEVIKLLQALVNKDS